MATFHPYPCPMHLILGIAWSYREDTAHVRREYLDNLATECTFFYVGCNGVMSRVVITIPGSRLLSGYIARHEQELPWLQRTFS